MHIKKIGLIGSGTMGRTIAQHFAMHQFPVLIYKPNLNNIKTIKQAIERDLTVFHKHGLLAQEEIQQAQNRIQFTDQLTALKDVDFVIEAAPEELSLKQELFKTLDELLDPSVILSTNTSSLDFFDIIEQVSASGKQRCIVCHWYNPSHIVPLVELSDMGNTLEEYIQQVEQLLQATGKKTIRVKKSIPGLVANRILQATAREVFSLMEQDIASAEDIDAALRYGPAFRYATAGQLQISDFGGIDIWCAVADNLFPEISSSQKASQLLRDKVQANQLGVKTGQGFYEYDEASAQKKIEAFQSKLIKQLKASQEMGE